jgi:hypothetical protein
VSRGDCGLTCCRPWPFWLAEVIADATPWLRPLAHAVPRRSAEMARPVQPAVWDHPNLPLWPEPTSAAVGLPDQILAVTEAAERTLCPLDVWPANLTDDVGTSVLPDPQIQIQAVAQVRRSPRLAEPRRFVLLASGPEPVLAELPWVRVTASAAPCFGLGTGPESG